MDLELIPDNIRLLVDNRRLLDVVKLAVDLDLFSKIADETSLDELSLILNLDSQFVEYLMRVLCSSGFAEAVPAGGGTSVYRSTPVSGQFLRQGSPLFIGQSVLERIETGELLGGYVRNGPVTPSIDKTHWTEERMRSIAGVALLGGIQSAMASADLAGRRRLLDIGGGHGLYSVFFTRKYPGLHATIVELPEVAAIARDYVARCEAADSVDIVAADYRDLRPAGTYDVVFLSNVAASLPEIGRLLSVARDSLEPGGKVVLRNFVSDAPDGPWSAITLLERYTRRGLKGLSTPELARAMEANGFGDIISAGYNDCTVILTGIKR